MFPLLCVRSASWLLLSQEKEKHCMEKVLNFVYKNVYEPCKDSKSSQSAVLINDETHMCSAVFRLVFHAREIQTGEFCSFFVLFNCFWRVPMGLTVN